MKAKTALEGVQSSQQKLKDQMEGVKDYIKNKTKFDGNYAGMVKRNQEETDNKIKKGYTAGRKIKQV